MRLAAALLLAVSFAGFARADDDAGLPLPATPSATPVAATPADEYAAIRARDEAIRGLHYQRPVPAHTITRDELAAFYKLEFELDHGDGSTDDTTWKALGFLDKDASFKDVYMARKRGKILGFYLDETVGPYAAGELYVIPENLTSDDHGETKAHELAHALNDQNFGLQGIYAALPRTATGQTDSDREQALMSLEEGMAFTVGKRSVDPSWTMSESNFFATPSIDRGTDYMTARANFRYVAGARFVEAVLKKGGFSLLDQVYKNPPTSTRQILHPELYLDGRLDPVAVTLPDTTRTLPGDWTTVEENSLGAFGTGWLTGASDGWAGDHWRVSKDRSTGQVIAAGFSTWDSERQAALFATAYVARRKALGLAEGALIHVEQHGRDVLVFTGARPDQVAKLSDALWKSEKTVPASNPKAPPSDGKSAGDFLSDLLSTATSSEAVAQVTSSGLRFLVTAHVDANGRAALARIPANVQKAVLAGTVIDEGGGRYYFPKEHLVFDSRDDTFTVVVGARSADETRATFIDSSPGIDTSPGVPSRTPGVAGALGR